MANIVRWFEDFPMRALELLGSMKEVAKASNRIGSLSLLVAPALLVAPYERLQQYAKRKNPQADYLAFPEAHKAFDRVMRTPFGKAEFWKAGGGAGIGEWRASQVERITADPSAWRTKAGHRLGQDAFWTVDLAAMETKDVWKYLRDALAHWNVATSDARYRHFDSQGTMERLLFYRAYDDKGPWDIISVTTEGFLGFLEAWATFLSQGLTLEVLAASRAA